MPWVSGQWPLLPAALSPRLARHWLALHLGQLPLPPTPTGLGLHWWASLSGDLFCTVTCDLALSLSMGSQLRGLVDGGCQR